MNRRADKIAWRFQGLRFDQTATTPSVTAKMAKAPTAPPGNVGSTIDIVASLWVGGVLFAEGLERAWAIEQD